MSDAPEAVHVRPAEAADAATLVQGNLAMATETEGVSLDSGRVRRGVERVFADPSLGRYLIAERQGEPVGQMMLTYEWSDWRDGLFWWIQSVYVAPEHRRTGVFRALYEKILADAEDDPGVCGVRLYVEQDNEAAISTYRALGMQDTVYRMLEVDLVLGRE